MKILNQIIFLLFFLVLEYQCDESGGRKVINTCSNLGYNQPTRADDCKEDGEICCYVHIKDPSNNDEIKFCVSSPSDIKMDDVKDEIKDYTNYSLMDLKCNKSQFIFYSSITILMMFFILF